MQVHTKLFNTTLQDCLLQNKLQGVQGGNCAFDCNCTLVKAPLVDWPECMNAKGHHQWMGLVDGTGGGGGLVEWGR